MAGAIGLECVEEPCDKSFSISEHLCCVASRIILVAPGNANGSIGVKPRQS